MVFRSLAVFFLLVAQLLPIPAPQKALLHTAAGETETYSTYLPVVAKPAPFLARNVIVLIGDGMGLEHVQAGSLYRYGVEGALSFEDFPYRARMTTASTSAITDSAAASTAMATGRKVDNGVLSQAIPGDGSDIYTLLEYASDYGMSTGLVTTTFIGDATPAGFGAHTSHRSHFEDVINDYLTGSTPNILFGGGGTAASAEKFSSAGYTVVTDRAGLVSLDTEKQTFVSGLFGLGSLPFEADGMGNYPHLSEMAGVALNILDNDPDGFFVMIEGGKIDSASHINDTGRMVAEVVEFSQTVQVAVDWAASHPDTIILVTADHETGGLIVEQNKDGAQGFKATWTRLSHSAANVGVWLTGLRLYPLPAVIDNTQIPALLTGGNFPHRP